MVFVGGWSGGVPSKYVLKPYGTHSSSKSTLGYRWRSWRKIQDYNQKERNRIDSKFWLACFVS